MGKGDIRYLRLKLKKSIIDEEFEKASVYKKWIMELGGDPHINIDELLDIKKIKMPDNN